MHWIERYLQNNWHVRHTNARTKHNLIRIFPINTIQYKTSQKITYTQKTDEATFNEDPQHHRGQKKSQSRLQFHT